jgi:hypothetical protein
MSVTISGSGQIVKQLVTTTKTSAFVSATTTSTWLDITGLSVNITPTNASNKIKITVMFSSGGGGNNYPRGYRVTRNGTAVSQGDAGTGTPCMGNDNCTSTDATWSLSMVAVDSPASTSALTYQVQVYNPPSSVTGCYINRPNSMSSNSFLSISTITVEEIAYA